MAEPVKFEEANDILRKPKGMTEEECADLHIYREMDPLPLVISCWELTEEEIQEIIETKRVWVGAVSVTHPPIFVTGQKPIQKE